MADGKPKVSVIIPTYNRAHLICRAIQSVLNQTYQDFEIIVVDDASTDNTEDVIIRNFNDSRIRFVRSQDNRGASAARNKGIELAKGKYIAFQDSDDEWFAEKLDEQIETFRIISPEVGVIYTDMLWVCKDGKIKYWHSPTLIDGALINPRTLDYQVAGIGIQSTLMKKEFVEYVGYFDEAFPKYIDLELMIRLSKHCLFYHIKKPLVKYYESDGIWSNMNTLPVARKLLLERYSNDIKKNKAFIAHQYFLIGCAHQACDEFTEAKSYFMKAFKIEPLSAKFLLLLIISSFGQKTFYAIRGVYRKIRNLKYGIWK